MRYIALRHLRVGKDVRAPGEEVPEAATWPRIGHLVDGGFLAVAPSPEAPSEPPTAKKRRATAGSKNDDAEETDESATAPDAPAESDTVDSEELPEALKPRSASGSRRMPQ